MRWPDDRAQELLDAMLVLLAVARKANTRQRVPAPVIELLSELTISLERNAAGGSSTIDVVESHGMVTVDEAVRRTGLGPRRIQQLCKDGLVTHDQVGRQYLVDVEDLHRHLAGA